MGYKIVYENEWVKVNNLMNKRFDSSRPCSICGKLFCGNVWYSIKTKIVKCLKCFTPEGH